ncbi:MAG: hypothetical protein NTW21_39110 [Verrucomicrobia bacterium]|nr:hypothetical protein [Verrucomicrobiota bacterium]
MKKEADFTFYPSRGGWRMTQQAFEQFGKSLRGFLPVRQMVAACQDAVRGEFLQKARSTRPGVGFRRSSRAMPTMRRCPSAKKLAHGGAISRHFVQPGGGQRQVVGDPFGQGQSWDRVHGWQAYPLLGPVVENIFLEHP